MRYSAKPTCLISHTTLAITACIAFCFLQQNSFSADWSITVRNSITLNTTATGNIDEMSGVVYTSEENGKHHFAAVQDGTGNIVRFTSTFGNDGSLLTATAYQNITLPVAKDYEAIVRGKADGTTVYMSEENTPTVREINLTTGVEVQAFSRPTVFNSTRSNSGFESLARLKNSSVVWTANEEALTIDGPKSSTSNGTVVRLLKYNITGNNLNASSQFAYKVDKFHANNGNSARSGLSELLVLPDGSLLALERSLAFNTIVFNTIIPSFESRIYAINFSGATDISQATFNSGLIGQTYQPVTKELLWSGQAGGLLGQNLEGLALGPKLQNGNYVILGVVDSGSSGDPLSSNTIISFELESTASPTSADFDNDGDVDGSDFLAWQSGFGISTGATTENGDADGDGDIDEGDFSIWETQFGSSVPNPLQSNSIPEPRTILLFLFALFPHILLRK